MAKIVNTSQQVRVGILSPPSLYSRTYSIELTMDPLLGFLFAGTPTFGEKLWLWYVQAQLRDKRQTSTTLYNFQIRAGRTRKITSDAFNQMEPVIPVHMENGNLTDWTFMENWDGMRIDTSRKFTGTPLQFFIRYTTSGTLENRLILTFNFSEG